MNNNVGTSDGNAALSTGTGLPTHARSTPYEAAFVHCRIRALSESNFVIAAAEPAH